MASIKLIKENSFFGSIGRFFKNIFGFGLGELEEEGRQLCLLQDVEIITDEQLDTIYSLFIYGGKNRNFLDQVNTHKNKFLKNLATRFQDFTFHPWLELVRNYPDSVADRDSIPADILSNNIRSSDMVNLIIDWNELITSFVNQDLVMKTIDELVLELFNQYYDESDDLFKFMTSINTSVDNFTDLKDFELEYKKMRSDLKYVFIFLKEDLVDHVKEALHILVADMRKIYANEYNPVIMEMFEQSKLNEMTKLMRKEDDIFVVDVNILKNILRDVELGSIPQSNKEFRMIRFMDPEHYPQANSVELI